MTTRYTVWDADGLNAGIAVVTPGDEIVFDERWELALKPVLDRMDAFLLLYDRHPLGVGRIAHLRTLVGANRSRTEGAPSERS
jgi:hypothetical protein